MITFVIISILAILIVGLLCLGALLNDAYKEYMSDEDEYDR